MTERILFSNWHLTASTGPDTPRDIDSPQAGTYQVRIVKGGPWVALWIWKERDDADADWTTRAVLGFGTPHDPMPGMEVEPSRVWPYAQPITYTQWERLSHRNRADGDLASYRAKGSILDVEPNP